MGKGHDDAEVVVVMERSISKLRNRDEARSFTGSGALRGSSVKVEECRASDCWPLCLASDDPVRGPAGTCADEGCLACAPLRLLFRRVSCGGAFDCSSSGGLSCSFNERAIRTLRACRGPNPNALGQHLRFLRKSSHVLPHLQSCGNCPVLVGSILSLIGKA